MELLKREIWKRLFGILNRNLERLMKRVRAEVVKVEPLITEQLACAEVADPHL